MAGGRVPVVVGPTAVGKTAVGARARGALAARDRLGRLTPGLSPARHRHRQADAEGARAGAAPRRSTWSTRARATAPATSRATRRAGWRISAPAAGCRSWSAAPGSTSGRWPTACSASRRWTRRGAGRSTPSPRGSSRSSCCAGPGGSIPAFGAGDASAPPAPSRWPSSPAVRSRTGSRRPARGARSTRGTLCSPCPGRCSSSGSRGGRRRWCGAG